MNYADMDILDMVRELKILLDKFAGNLTKTDVEQIRVLSNNLSKECSDILYDWGK
jgi:hypothetical protein